MASFRIPCFIERNLAVAVKGLRIIEIAIVQSLVDHDSILEDVVPPERQRRDV
jgi:hypothetical protein